MTDKGRHIAIDTQQLVQPHALDETNTDEFDLSTLFNGKLAEAIRNVPPEFDAMNEIELGAAAKPTATEYKIRQRVTTLVEQSRREGNTPITTTSIYDGVVSRQTFFDFYLPNPAKVAWMIRPVIPHAAYYDAIHKEGLKKLFLYVKNHDLDPKTIGTFARIVEKAADRNIGPVVQRIAMHQKQEITHSAGQSEREVDSNDPAQIKAKIDELTAKMHQVKALEIPAKTVEDDD